MFLVESHTFSFFLHTSLLQGLLIPLPHQGPLPPPVAMCRCKFPLGRKPDLFFLLAEQPPPLHCKSSLSLLARTAGCFCETPTLTICITSLSIFTPQCTNFICTVWEKMRAAYRFHDSAIVSLFLSLSLRGYYSSMAVIKWGEEAQLKPSGSIYDFLWEEVSSHRPTCVAHIHTPQTWRTHPLMPCEPFIQNSQRPDRLLLLTWTHTHASTHMDAHTHASTHTNNYNKVLPVKWTVLCVTAR